MEQLKAGDVVQIVPDLDILFNGGHNDLGLVANMLAYAGIETTVTHCANARKTAQTVYLKIDHGTYWWHQRLLTTTPRMMIDAEAFANFLEGG